MAKFLILLLLGALLIFACGHQEGIIQKAEKSFIFFSGNLENVVIHIDKREPFAPSYGRHYEMLPGKHTFMAYRGGNLLLNKIVILENQVTMEIRIP